MVLLVAYNNVALIIGINKYVKVDYKADLMETHDAIDNIEKKILEEFGVNLTIHIDPILNIHDFRVVFGPTHTNILFDIVTL